MRKRITYIAATIILLVTEVLIGLFVHDRFVRPFVGDVLVVILIYTFIRIFIPEKFRLLPLFVFVFAAGVEVLQYFDIVTVLHLENNPLMRTVIGTSFDVHDILCYFTGCLITGVWEIVGNKYR